MKKRVSVVILAGFVGILALSRECIAGCTVQSPVTQIGNFPTSFTISSSQAIGTTVGSEITVQDSVAAYVTCTGGAVYTILRLNPSWSASGIANVFNTSIPGIGVKVREESGYGVLAALTPVLQKWYATSDNYTSNALLAGIKVQFYVTGSLESGEYPAETIVEAWMNNTISTSGGANYVTLKLPPITVKKLTCETPNISVDLDKHMSSEFSGINSKSTAKAFNFEIKKCDPGMNSVNYTFKPAAGVTLKQAGTSNQYITLDGNSTATGVGIQVLYENDTLVPFNSKIKYTGYNKTTGGSYTIPMKARYIQTASTITGGTANSAVEFTMSYE